MEFKLDPIFSDHMILQRNQHIRIWGTAREDGLSLEIELAGQVCRQVKGLTLEWSVLLPPLEAGGPYELNIRSPLHSVTLRDVWIGEVWVAGGQSNMEWELSLSELADQDIPAADYPYIRYYQVPKTAVLTDHVMPASRWEICSPETAGHFSAVAFYFARKVWSALNVPVGIINCNWGGTSAACWIDEHDLRQDETLRIYWGEYVQEVRAKTPEQCLAEIQQYDEAVARYNALVEQCTLRGVQPTVTETGPYPWPPPMTTDSFLRPGGLYHTMLRNITAFPVAGAIYYQGEADTGKASLYARLLKTLIERWRGDWGLPDMPFLFVQLTAFGENARGEDWSLLREAQYKVSCEVPNTYMAVSIDCGEPDDIHPKRKQPIGDRLALLALRYVYSLNLNADSPAPGLVYTEQDAVVVEWDHAYDGLQCSGELRGFELAGEDQKYMQAHAVIEQVSSIRLTCPEVGQPMYVRYAWYNVPDANLYNSAGLPAMPFRMML